MFRRRHYGENPWYLTDPPVEHYEQDTPEEDYNELYNLLFENNIMEENREFINYEQEYIDDLIKHEQGR